MAFHEKDSFSVDPKGRIDHDESLVSLDAHKEVLGATKETLVIDDTISKRVVRKYDYHILPLFLLINLFSFIDRVNIGNARLLGLQRDLELGVGLRYSKLLPRFLERLPPSLHGALDVQWGLALHICAEPQPPALIFCRNSHSFTLELMGADIALMCLFVSYCVVELPSNIACKKIGGHRWIPFLVFCFSILTICTSVVQNRQGLYAIRFLLGCAEGGISPGLVWMLSQVYRRSELGFRTSIYISAASGSGAFGGLLAIGLSSIPRWGLIHTWRNIFFFEGLISLIIAAVAFWQIPKGPERATFLTEEEKDVAVNRLRVDSAGTSEGDRTRWKHIRQALSSTHVLVCGVGFFFGNTAAQSFSVFAPSIIAAMGYSSTRAQLLSVGPYVVACVFSVLVGWLSDRYKKRAVLIIGTVPLGIAGFFMLEFLPADRPSAKYGALYLAATGIYAFLPIWLAWAVNNCATPTVRAAASGIVFTMGSLGGVLAPWIYLASDAPNYRTGHAILLSFLCGSWACAIGLLLFCKWENRQRDMGKRDHLLEGLSEQEALELSSRHPAFRYMT